MPDKTPSLRGAAAKVNDSPEPCIVLIMLAMTVLLFSSAAHAGSTTYAPGHCEFTATFPGKPYTVRRCEDENENRCYNLVSYTQTFELNATVNVRVICNPIGPAVRKKYSEDVSRASVRAMARKNAVRTFETKFRNEGPYKMASLAGEGRSGRTPKIYIAQLWVGEKSVMSVEAELIGQPFEAADKVYSDILRSVGPKEKKEKGKGENEKTETEDSKPDSDN